MTLRPPRPPSPLLDALPWALALVAALGAWLAVRAAAPRPAELAALLPRQAVARHAAAVEEGWVEAALPRHWVAAPPAAPPCATGVETVPAELRRRVAAAAGRGGEEGVAALGALARDHPESWLPALAYAQALIARGRLGDAERVLDRALARGGGARLVAGGGEAVRRGWRGPPREEVLAAIHLLHAAGYTRIERHRPSSDELWKALKNPIGLAGLLHPGDPTWIEHPLPAPGCDGRGAALTTYDLYNNLIVGYLATPDFHETEPRRERELRRDYRDPPEENPLQAVLAHARAEWRPEREAWVWAVSNAERLLRERLWGGSLAPPDPLLAVNLAQLAESARGTAPPAARRGLAWLEHALVAAARSGRPRVPAARGPVFDRALARVALLDAVRRGAAPELPVDLVAGLDEEGREAAGAVAVAVALRSAPDRWAAAATGDDPAAGGDALDGRRGEWLAASRADLAAALARQVRGAPAPVRRPVARRARALLAPGDPRPAVLAEIEQGLPWWWRLSPQRWLTGPLAAAVAAALAAVVAALVGWWIAIQLRLRRSVFTSFYRLEAEERVRGRA